MNLKINISTLIFNVLPRRILLLICSCLVVLFGCTDYLFPPQPPENIEKKYLSVNKEDSLVAIASDPVLKRETSDPDRYGYRLRQRERQELMNRLESFQNQMLNDQNDDLAKVKADRLPPKITIFEPKMPRAAKLTHNEKKLRVRGKAIDSSGILEVLVNGKYTDLNESGYFLARVPLRIGDNRINVTAEDLEGNRSTETFTIQRVSSSLRKPVVKNPLENTGRYYALLIAVEDYEHPSVSDLDNPVKDARRLKTVLEQEYRFDQIKLLENPDRREIITSLGGLRSKLTQKDSLLVFYAGHGFWDEGIEQGYWLPSDAEQNNPVDWISNGTLRDYLRGIKSRHTLVISDACFSGSILKTRSAFAKAAPVFQQLHKLPSRKAITSGTLNEVPDRSVFLEYLIKRLQQNEEALLTSQQLFSSFRVAVINNSPNQQIPQYGDIQQAGDEGGDFIFIKR